MKAQTQKEYTVVSKELRKANLRVALILGIVVVIGMSSTFFMLSDRF